jgi:hypothetical protein
VTPDILAEAIVAVTPEILKERCARVVANGGIVEQYIEWWRCVLDNARDMGCIQTSCVLEFCESRGRQEKKEITEEAAATVLHAEACAGIVKEIKRQMRPIPVYQDMDVLSVRGMIEERGGSIRATVRTADGCDHVYKITEKKISRRKSSTPATLGSRDVINNSRTVIESLRQLASSTPEKIHESAASAIAEMLKATLKEYTDIKIKKID